MKTIFKILISLAVASAVLFIFAVLSALGYQSKIETRFYKPAVIAGLDKKLSLISNAAETWHSGNIKTFSEFIQNGAVKRSIFQGQSDADIKVREAAASSLMLALTGIQGIRIIDSESQNIHFSTFSSDILLKTETLISYKKYNADSTEFAYNFITTEGKSGHKILADGVLNSFVYIFPFFDNYNIYRGEAVFYVSSKSLVRHLIAEKLLTISDDISLLPDTQKSFLGIVTGLPYSGNQILKENIIKMWEKGDIALNHISYSLHNNNFSAILVTKKTASGYVGQVCNPELFCFTPMIKSFFVIICCITVFLLMFLLLNIRQDKLFVVQHKIKGLHIKVLNDLIKEERDRSWQLLQDELNYKRHYANAEIKKGLGKRFVSKYEKDIDIILEKNWEAIFGIINKKQNTTSNENEEILRLLRQIIDNTSQNTKNVQVIEKPVMPLTDSVKAPLSNENEEEILELETLDEMEEVQELEPLEELTECSSEDDVEELLEVEEEASGELPNGTAGEKKVCAENLDDPDCAEDDETEELLAEPDIEEPCFLDYGQNNILKNLSIQSLDFSFLDSQQESSKAIEEAEYISPYSSGFEGGLKYQSTPLLGELEVVNDEEESLLNISSGDSIISRDGIFFVQRQPYVKGANLEFKKLVDSVLSPAH